MESQIPIVQPQPIPFSLSIDEVDIQGKKFIALSFFSFSGQAVYFLDLEHAASVAKLIQNTVRQAKVGLILPNNKIVRKSNDS